MKKEKPDFVTDEHLKYLEELKESRVTNMFGASPYLAKAFNIPIKRAREIWSYWVSTYEVGDK
jgi:hypothetical protein